MEEQLRTLMATVFGVEQSAIGKSTTPATIKVWDSLMQIRLIFALEEEFGIKFRDGDLAEMQSYDSILSAIKERMYA